MAIDQRSGMTVLGYTNEPEPVILLGSSYSASLALLLGIGNDKVDRVVAFSPGEYLKNVRVHARMAELSKTVFVTSLKREIADTRALIRSIPSSI